MPGQAAQTNKGLAKHAPPLALYERADNALRIAALNAAGAGAGLYVGQPLAEARALLPGLEAAPRDAEADARDFAALIAALTRYSPFVAGPSFGVAFVDMTGGAHLFGGEARLLADAGARLARAGVASRRAIADAPGAAYAVAAFASAGAARAGAMPERRRGLRNPGWAGETARRDYNPSTDDTLFIVAPGGAAAAVAALPVEALRLDARIAQGLRTVGLKTVGAVMEQPRKALAKRFGERLLRRLDEATGVVFESLSPHVPPPDFTVFRAVAEPLMTIDAALEAAAQLARALDEMLAREGVGARRFVLHFFRLDNSFVATEVRLAAPARDAEAVLRLFRLKFEKGDAPVDPGFGFESFRLSAFEAAPLSARQKAAFEREGPSDVEALKNQLANYLGQGAVRLSAPEDAHLPERAEARHPMLASTGAPWAPLREDDILRPLFLLAHPEPVEAIALAPDGPPARFVWRRVGYRVAKAAGPERLIGEWRRGENFFRDYYRLEDSDGRRCWIFRDGHMGEGAKWFLHGWFA